VSTRKMQLFGCARAQASKASTSVSNAITQLWAWVPRTGRPKRRPASTFEVPEQPPTYAAREALRPPSKGVVFWSWPLLEKEVARIRVVEEEVKRE